MNMEYCYAPMEGITLSRFRQIHHEMFPGVSEYYTPFIAPDSNGGFRAKFLRELTTDCGQVPLIPQLLVNNVLDHQYRLSAWVSSNYLPATDSYDCYRGWFQQPGINVMGRVIYRF